MVGVEIVAQAHPPEESRSLIAMIWPRRWLVLAMIVVGAVIAFAISSATGSSSVSDTARIFLSRTQPFEPFAQNAQQVDPVRYTANQASLLTSTPVLNAASAALPDHPSLKTLQDNTKVDTSTTADVISVTVTADSGATAAQRANAIVAAYRTIQKDDVTTQATAAAAATPDAATKAQILAQAQIAGDGVAVAEPATAADAHSSESKTTITLLGALGGLILGLIGALIADGMVAHRRRAKLDPADLLGVPLLGAVNAPSGGRGVNGASAVELHLARRMLTAIEYASHRPYSGVLLITAASVMGEGNATLEIAAAAAADGRRVVLVDARTPRLRRGGESARNEPSLVDLAAPETALKDVAYSWTAFPGRQIPVVRGRIADSAGGWLGPSMAVERALLRLSNEADLIIIDAPPASADETFLLMGLADAGIVVVATQTTATELANVKSAFDFAGAPLIGFVTTTSAGKKPDTTPQLAGPGSDQPETTALASTSKV